MATRKKIMVKGITRDELSAMITHWEKFAGCYFWRSPGSASQRRREEKMQSREWAFVADGIAVEVSITITCSCKNYYADKRCYVADVRKAQGLRYLKKLAKLGQFEGE